MFTEVAVRHRMNRRLAKTVSVEPAVMADARSGVVIKYGDHLVVLTDDEALALANRIADCVDQP